MTRNIHTITQVSAGGVAYRHRNGKTEVVLISVGEPPRWQLPKGGLEEGETRQAAAQREVHEEAGVKTDLIEPIGKIEYWFYVTQGAKRTRVHKTVYYYLLRYLSGDPSQHDDEVHRANWQQIDQAYKALTFDNEKEIVRKAGQMIAEIHEE
jgi:8-oxo-dGTP pyrophosphatase MutT (NUDIX family)